MKQLDTSVFLAIADRRDHLCRKVPRCGQCGSEQVQLTSVEVPAGWRCRMCRQKFRHEPEASK